MAEEFNQEIFQNLLERISDSLDKNEELMKAQGTRFNMFKILGVNHYETLHSKILAELLKPKGSHDMGEAFLEAFLKITLPVENISNETNETVKKEESGEKTTPLTILAQNCSVRTEVSFTLTEEGKIVSGRMDILIEDTVNKTAICIENKVYAEDQDKQLIRYNTYLKTGDFSDYRIFYLSLWGKDADKESAGDVSYMRLSNKKHIVTWLDECIKLSAEKPMVRETLCQYRNHIQKLTGTNLEKQYMNEMIKVILENEQNFKVIKAISNIYSDNKAMVSYILNKEEIVDLLKKHLESRGVEITTESNFDKPKYPGFWLLHNKFSIRFEFRTQYFDDFYCGFTHRTPIENFNLNELQKKYPDFENDNSPSWYCKKNLGKIHLLKLKELKAKLITELDILIKILEDLNIITKKD